MTIQYMACDSANIDTTTGVCSSPVWVQQPSLIPPMDAATGVTLSVAILVCWAMAWGLKSMQRPGD